MTSPTTTRRQRTANILRGIALAMLLAGTAAAAAPVQEIRPPHMTPVEIALTRGGTYRVDMQTQAVTYVPADVSGLEETDKDAQETTAYTVYDNFSRPGDVFTGFGYGVDSHLVCGDRIQLTQGGHLRELGYTIYHSGGTLLTSTHRIRIFDATGWSGQGYPTNLITTLDVSIDHTVTFGPGGLPPATLIKYEAANLLPGVEVPQEILMTQEMIAHTGSTVFIGTYARDNPTPYVGWSDPVTCFVATDAVSPEMYQLIGVPNNNVVFDVGVCITPDIQVSPASISAAVSLGGNVLLLQWIQISNADGCAPLEYSFASDCGLSAAPGVVPAGEVRSVDLNFGPFGFWPGTHTGSLFVYSNDMASPQLTIPVTFTITGSVGLAQPGTGYATQGSGGGAQWVEIDLATGAGTVVGWTGYPVPGLAVYGGSVLLAGGANNSYWQVDEVTGTLVEIPTYLCVTAMAAADEVLYGLGCGGDLHRIDPFTGTLSPPDLTGIAPAMSGLAVDPTTGTVYLAQADAGPGMDHLYRWLGTGAPLEDLGSTGLGMPLIDLACDATGQLFGIAGGPAETYLVGIDKDAAYAVVIGPTGIANLDAFAIAGTAPDFTTSAPTSAPPAVTLHGASPNPFNPATEIAFDLPRAGKVQLVVYDLAGHRVATLVDGTLPAGPHSVQFRADRLGSGAYFYELRGEGYRETRKMMLVK